MPPLSFSSLGLSTTILRALRARGYATPTPIQRQAIPHLLAGEDLLGIAQTGTGKTAAFALPVLQHLAGAGDPVRPRAPRALVLAPTRELAIQIHDDFRDYGAGSGLRQTVILGGVSQHPQVAALSRPIDIVVATPGRLLDLCSAGPCRPRSHHPLHPGRGGPHARHGVHPRRQEGHPPATRTPPIAAVLRHHAARRGQPGARACCTGRRAWRSRRRLPRSQRCNSSCTT